EITARLHLDQLQRHLARVFQAVIRAHGNERRFVFAQQENVFATRHPRGAADHHPVLGTMMVHLQTELAAGFDGDPLDLKALGHVNGIVSAPRRYTLRCKAASERASCLRRPTTSRTFCTWSLRATSTASSVSTTTMSSRPIMATRRRSLHPNELRQSSANTSP